MLNCLAIITPVDTATFLPPAPYDTTARQGHPNQKPMAQGPRMVGIHLPRSCGAQQPQLNQKA